ncbi:hypothetical protein SOVF_116080 [Spinacia oleracea]|nr:hypothetical protein SOVF_116080 [Spinacia oleracea]
MDRDKSSMVKTLARSIKTSACILKFLSWYPSRKSDYDKIEDRRPKT